MKKESMPHVEEDRFADLPSAALSIWAKSGDDGQQGQGLLAHMLDVAAVAERILRREPPSTVTWAANQFRIEEAELVRWVAWLAGQHDLGKATVGFQLLPRKPRP